MNEERKANEPSAKDILESIQKAAVQDKVAGTATSRAVGKFAIGTGKVEDQKVVFDVGGASQLDTPRDRVGDGPQSAPLVTEGARVSVGKSLSALASLAQAGVPPVGAAKEMAMPVTNADELLRPISQIEKDLLTAETNYSDAETRRQQAERDGQAALAEINRFQAEIDAAIGRLRQKSPAGSNWSGQTDRSANVLTLRNEVPPE
jgi:hypothetical protein